MTRGARVFVVWLTAFVAAACGDEEAPTLQAPGPREEGPPVIVEAKVDAARIDIGARVVYHVEVRARDGFEVEYPPILDQFEGVHLLDGGLWQDQPDRGDRRVRSMRIVFDPGIGPTLTIPKSRLRWRKEGDGDDGWQTSETDEITVEITSSADFVGDFREPDDLFELPPAPKSADGRAAKTFLIVAGSGLGLLAVLWILLFRRRRERRLPPLPPHEIAQRELAHLDSLGLVETGRFKEYYYRLTAILRRYIELRFGIMAPERTTEEFLVEMRRSHELPAEQKSVLDEFLRAADLVKYAAAVPAPNDARSAWEIAERFVKVTIQHSPVAPEETD